MPKNQKKEPISKDDYGWLCFIQEQYLEDQHKMFHQDPRKKADPEFLSLLAQEELSEVCYIEEDQQHGD